MIIAGRRRLDEAQVVEGRRVAQPDGDAGQGPSWMERAGLEPATPACRRARGWTGLDTAPRSGFLDGRSRGLQGDGLDAVGHRYLPRTCHAPPDALLRTSRLNQPPASSSRSSAEEGERQGARGSTKRSRGHRGACSSTPARRASRSERADDHRLERDAVRGRRVSLRGRDRMALALPGTDDLVVPDVV
jgi:hypothetical protein